MKWWLWIVLVGFKVSGLWFVVQTGYSAIGWGLFFTGGLIVMAHHLIPNFQGLCDVVTGYEGEGRTVWLTIDDGPDPSDTGRILALLETYNAKATFFMIGARAERHPELVRRVVEAGHTIGCHSFSHPKATFWFAGRRRVARELDRSIAVLAKAGAQVQLYRSPVGIKNISLRRCLRERGLTCVGWTLRSGDGLGKNPVSIIQHVLRRVRPGSIILMHEGENVAAAVRVSAIEGVLRGLQQKGYRCVVPDSTALRVR
jgi:peptidoglycan/xylan/chitin deacetylase (PgdA/CDA1 family)